MSLIFIIVETLILPLQIIGLIVCTCRIRRISIPQKITGAVNEPYGDTWYCLADLSIQPVDDHPVNFFRFFLLGPVTAVHHRVLFQVADEVFHAVGGRRR